MGVGGGHRRKKKEKRHVGVTNNLNRSCHIARIDGAGTYPWLLGAEGRNCIGVTVRDRG